jgi:hypothetical protein
MKQMFLFAQEATNINPEESGKSKSETLICDETTLSLEKTELPSRMNQPKQVETRANAIGFTGTRKGLTEKQKRNLTQTLLKLQPTEFHHGCCNGADLQAEEIVVELILMGDLDCVIHQHPPINMGFAEVRKFRIETVVHEPELYIQRNHSIVDASYALIGCPETKEEQLRSGTWATIRYARKQKKPVITLHP